MILRSHTRRRRIASAAATAAAAALPALPDEILESIFLLLDSAADLARAASACTCFRRVASGHPFLRRFASLHGPPPLLGLLLPGDGFHPAEPPHRSASAAAALARAADFTFSFVPDHPDGGGWTAVRDARDGRVLLSRPGADAFDEFVVCDPLHRRYVRVPAVPDELVMSIPPHECAIIFISPFLAPPAAVAEDADEAPPSSFSVIHTIQLGNTVMAFFFASGGRRWRASTPYVSSTKLPYGWRHRYYALGCFHWMISPTSSLVLDTRDLKFSTITLPPAGDLRHRAIFETGEGRLGIVAFSNGLWPSSSRFSCEIWQQNSGAVDTQDCWQLYKTIPLPGYKTNGMHIQAEADNYLLLRPILPPALDVEFFRPKHCFVLDLKTLLFDAIFSIDVGYRADLRHLYVSFPPPLAPPRL